MEEFSHRKESAASQFRRSKGIIYAGKESKANKQMCTKFQVYFSYNAKIGMLLLGALDTILNGNYNMVNVSQEM